MTSPRRLDEWQLGADPRCHEMLASQRRFQPSNRTRHCTWLLQPKSPLDPNQSDCHFKGDFTTSLATFTSSRVGTCLHRNASKTQCRHISLRAISFQPLDFPWPPTDVFTCATRVEPCLDSAKRQRCTLPSRDSLWVAHVAGPKSWKHDPPRTRTWNLRLRRPTPYPLGQQAN